jgi:hypothetical protein
MGIRPTFSNQDVRHMFNIKLARIEDAIISRLRFIGETFVINARENGTYNDITGNLRSSIGYIVLNNGKVVVENFERSNRGSDKSTGVSKGRSHALSVKKRFSKGYVLICVAGMQYAAAVESRGKDVITASSITAKNDMQRAINSLKRKVGNL